MIVAKAKLCDPLSHNIGDIFANKTVLHIIAIAFMKSLIQYIATLQMYESKGWGSSNTISTQSQLLLGLELGHAMTICSPNHF